VNANFAVGFDEKHQTQLRGQGSLEEKIPSHARHWQRKYFHHQVAHNHHFHTS
jgi:hypothetical protein